MLLNFLFFFSNKISPASATATTHHPQFTGRSQNELSVDEISLGSSAKTPGFNNNNNNNSNNGNHHHLTDDRLAGHIPDTIMEEEQQNESESYCPATVSSSSSSSSSRDSLKVTPTIPNSSSNCYSNASSPVQSVKHFHTSVPNLRTTSTITNNTISGATNGKPPLHPSPPKKKGRSCSHGDVQLRKNFGSTDLLSRAFLNNATSSKRNSIADIPRHGSVENVLNVERRRQKTPTIVNRIHNLEVGILHLLLLQK